MKKNLFFLAAAAVALASCSNDEQIAENSAASLGNQPQEIALTAISQPNTRGQYSVITTGFPEDNTMEVKAYQTQPSAAAYFDKCTFSKSGTTWKGGQYWPLSAAKINFFAVSGYNVDADDITIEDLLAYATVQYKATGNTSGTDYLATTQSDIMYAFGRGEVTKDGNALTFPTNVPMQFKHALALVDFQVKGATATEVGAITVNSITLKGATYNGTLTLTNTNAATEASEVTTAVSWAAGDAVASVAVPGISASTAITDTYARIGNGLMVIPGTGFSSFVINYSMNGNSYDYEYTPTPAVSSTTANNKYTYQINFKLHEIEIAPTVDEWIENTEYVNIPTMTYGADPTYELANGAKGTYTFTITGLTEGHFVKVTDDHDSTGKFTVTSPASTYTVTANGTVTITGTLADNEGSAAASVITLKQYSTSEAAAAGTGEETAFTTTITINQAGE